MLTDTFTISKYAKAGLWHVDQITITDVVGNKRFAGANDFGWSFYVNNVLEDTDKPVYIKNSMSVTSGPAMLKGHALHKVTVAWLFTDASEMKNGFARLIDDNTATHSTSSLQEYTSSSTHGITKSKKCGAVQGTGVHCYRAAVQFMLTEFRAPAHYTASQLVMVDVAGNTVTVDPTHDWVAVQTSNFDSTAPEVNVNEINVQAEPTNPGTPNGETRVEITCVRSRVCVRGACSTHMLCHRTVAKHRHVPGNVCLLHSWSFLPCSPPQ